MSLINLGRDLWSLTYGSIHEALNYLSTSLESFIAIRRLLRKYVIATLVMNIQVELTR